MSDDCCATEATQPAISACGCPTTTASDSTDPLAYEALPPWYRNRALLLSLAAGIFLVLGFTFERLSATNTPIATLCYVFALVSGGSTFVPGALRRLVQQQGLNRLGIALLMTLAAIGATLLGHLGEAAALAFLFSIAEALEERAFRRARHNLRSLLALLPETARTRCSKGCIDTVAVAEVQPGDILQVRAGDRLATDGIVVEGSTTLDTSAVTGESIPADVYEGSTVLAGCINRGSTIYVQATAPGQENSLTRIVKLVEQAQLKQGTQARLADRIARPLVPLVLGAAILTAMLGCLLGDPEVWINRALVVLVAASPCALAIAVPVTVISAIGGASRLGATITSGAAFEALGTIRHIAFDKTGTLTKNQPSVVAVRTLSEFAEAEVLNAAAALEAASSHPLAQAITAAAPTVAPATEVTEHPGCGLSGMVAGQQVRVGNARWLAPKADAAAIKQMTQAGMTVVLVEIGGVLAGLVGLRDELRGEAPTAIAALAHMEISSCMLTGDNVYTAAAIAAQAGIEEVHAELLPADKARLIAASTAQTPTAMIGDGINDTPALAAATIGIAIGTGGNAAATETADVIFSGSDLRLLPAIFTHARRGRRIMTTNVGFALLIIIGLFPLALSGVLNLAAVVLIHEVAEILIIINGLRAGRVQPHLTGAAGTAGAATV